VVSFLVQWCLLNFSASYRLSFFKGWWAWEVSASKWDKRWWWYVLGIGEVNDKMQKVFFSDHRQKVSVYKFALLKRLKSAYSYNCDFVSVLMSY
jgi:hypothetical protein